MQCLGSWGSPRLTNCARRAPDVQSFPPLYEIEICSGLCAKASATCWYSRWKRPRRRKTHRCLPNASSTTPIDSRSCACTFRSRGLSGSSARKASTLSLSSRHTSCKEREAGRHIGVWQGSRSAPASPGKQQQQQQRVRRGLISS